MQDHPCDKHWVFFFLCLTEGQDLRGVSTANTPHSDSAAGLFLKEHSGNFRAAVNTPLLLRVRLWFPFQEKGEFKSI